MRQLKLRLELVPSTMQEWSSFQQSLTAGERTKNGASKRVSQADKLVYHLEKQLVAFH